MKYIASLIKDNKWEVQEIEEDNVINTFTIFCAKENNTEADAIFIAEATKQDSMI